MTSNKGIKLDIPEQSRQRLFEIERGLQALMEKRDLIYETIMSVGGLSSVDAVLKLSSDGKSLVVKYSA